MKEAATQEQEEVQVLPTSEPSMSEQHGSKTEGRGDDPFFVCAKCGNTYFSYASKVENGVLVPDRSRVICGNCREASPTPSPQSPSEPGRGDDLARQGTGEAVGRSDEEMERAIEQSEVEFFKELRRRGAAPPSQPEGVREALNKFEDFINLPTEYEDQTRVRDYRHELWAEWTKLYFVLKAAPTAPSRGLVEAAEWRATLETACKRIQLVRNELTDDEQSLMLKSAIADIDQALRTLIEKVKMITQDGTTIDRFAENARWLGKHDKTHPYRCTTVGSIPSPTDLSGNWKIVSASLAHGERTWAFKRLCDFERFKALYPTKED